MGRITYFKKKICMMMCIVLFAGALMSGPASFVSTATSSTQQQINKTQKEKKELEDKLKKNNTKLDDLKGEHNSLKKELGKLNDQLTEVVSNLEELEDRITLKEQEIEDTKAALALARETEQQQYDNMVTRVRYMYENRDDSYVSTILKGSSLSGVLNTADYVERIAAYDRKMMDYYVQCRILVEEEEDRLESEMNELEILKVQTEAEKSKVSGLVSQTSNSIAEYAEDISDAEKQALEYEAQIKKADEDLSALKKKLAEEMALSQAAAGGKWRDISEVSFADGDRKLLANIIYCEAGSEPYAGKLAVGSVIINRVLSSKFPDSVVGVVYQKSQFSPASSGRLELALASDRANADCYKAADEAMSGVTNVGNCVFFRTPVPGLTGISIGGHIFY